MYVITLFGSVALIVSPTFLPMIDDPIGEVWEIIPFSGLLSSDPRIVNVVSFPLDSSVTVCPMVILLLFFGEIIVA